MPLFFEKSAETLSLVEPVFDERARCTPVCFASAAFVVAITELADGDVLAADAAIEEVIGLTRTSADKRATLWGRKDMPSRYRADLGAGCGGPTRQGGEPDVTWASSAASSRPRRSGERAWAPADRFLSVLGRSSEIVATPAALATGPFGCELAEHRGHGPSFVIRRRPVGMGSRTSPQTKRHFRSRPQRCRTRIRNNRALGPVATSDDDASPLSYRDAGYSPP